MKANIPHVAKPIKPIPHISVLPDVTMPATYDAGKAAKDFINLLNNQ